MTDLKKQRYELEANIGEPNKPFIIKHEIGVFQNDDQAIEAAKVSLSNVYQNMTWTLQHKGGERVCTLRSSLNIDKGYVLEAHLTSDTLAGFAKNLDKIKEKIEDFCVGGGSVSDTCSYEFDLAGKDVRSDK